MPSGFAVATGALAAGVMTATVATLRRRRSLARRIEALLAVRSPAVRLPTTASLLPEPVSRYFRFARAMDYHAVGPIRMEQEGEFRFAPASSWRRFTATQYVNPAGPGFLWDATFPLLPGIGIRVRDGYCDGVGRLEARIAGFPVARQENSTTLAAGELHRYLAEAVWNPAALRPEEGIVWDPIDRDSARATLSAHGISVSLDCLFDREGRLTKAFTRERYRDVEGKAVATPWLCEYRDYARMNRVMVPREGEVSWLLPDGAFSYCRLRVTAIRHLDARQTAAGTLIE